MHKTHYVFGSLVSWGWVALITGILELLASGSLVGGHRFGRYFGIAVGAVAAVESVLEIPEQLLLSLAVFAISLWIIHGLAIYAGPVEKGGPVDSADARPSIGPPPMRSASVSTPGTAVLARYRGARGDAVGGTRFGRHGSGFGGARGRCWRRGSATDS